MMQQPQPQPGQQQQPPPAATMDQQQQYQQWLWAQQQQQQQQPPQQPPPQQQGQYQYPQQQQQYPPQQQQQYQYPQQQYVQQQPQPQQQQSGGGDEIRTLWIGDLQYWMDESFISNCFSQSGVELTSVKIIRNKQTMQSEGYGFIEFASHAGAERILQTYNGTLIPNSDQNFRLNWASYGSGEKRADDGFEYTIFVGDLAPDVTDYNLQEAFRAFYPSVKGAKIVMDKLTGRPKGYGFVRFGDESEQQRAMTEMNGVDCGGRAMRIGAAASKKTVGGTASYQNNQGAQNDSDPTNTTLFVGNLDADVTDEHLRQAFSSYGELVHVKIPVGKSCGFVQFNSRSSAEEALNGMNGAQLGGRNVRLSWGHNSSTNRKPQAEQNQYNNNAGYYGYQQGYDPYAYAAGAAGAAPAPQDPNMYYGGGYPQGYGGYAMPQQGQHPAQHQQ